MIAKEKSKEMDMLIEVGERRAVEVEGRVRVSAPISYISNDLNEAAGNVSLVGACREIWLEWPADYHVPDLDDASPFVAIVLPVALCTGYGLRVAGTVDESFYLNVMEVISLFNAYFPATTAPVDLVVNIDSERGDNLTPGKIASFYSGGVDSLFNIEYFNFFAENSGFHGVTDLWMVGGLDVPLDVDNGKRWRSIASDLSDFAAKHFPSMRVVDIRTNARVVHGRFVPYTKLGFGPILAGISKCFSSCVSTALVGSWGTYKQIVPHASTPQLDALWSCKRQQIRHFSARFSRQQKIDFLVESCGPYLAEGLRVCYQNAAEQYNCGVCEKCIRSRFQLLIAGLSGVDDIFVKSPSFPDLNRIRLSWREGQSYGVGYWVQIFMDSSKRGLTCCLYRSLYVLLKNLPRIYVTRIVAAIIRPREFRE